MSIISERIKQRRLARDMTADQVAQLIGVGRSTVFRWENGETQKIKIDVLCELAKVLDTTPAYLLGWSETKEQQKARKLRSIFDTFVEYRGDDEIYEDKVKDEVMSEMCEFFDYIMYRHVRRKENELQEVSQGADD